MKEIAVDSLTSTGARSDGDGSAFAQPMIRRRSPAALAARHSHMRLGAPLPRPAPDPATYRLPQRPWRVLPMAVLAILAVLAVSAGTGWAMRSTLGAPDPGEYVSRVVDQAAAATR